MKKFLVFSALFLIHVLVFSQSNSYFNKIFYPFTGANTIVSVLSSDSCYYAFGLNVDTPYYNVGIQGFDLLKIDLYGNIIEKSGWLDSSLNLSFGNFYNNCFIEIKNDLLIACGAAFDTNNDGRGVLISFNKNLDTLWTKFFNHPDTLAASQPGADVFNSFTAIKQTYDNGFIIAGNYNKNCITGNIRSYLLKTDSLGNMEWIKTYLNLAGSYDLEITYDSGFLFPAVVNETYIALVKTNSFGNVQWTTKVNSSTLPHVPYDVEIMGGKNAFVCSAFWIDNNYTRSAIKLAKVELDSGNKIWEKELYPYYSFECYTLHQNMGLDILSDSTMIISCTSKVLNPSGSGEGSYKGVLMKLNQNGDSLWARYYGYGTFMDYCQLNDIALTDDDGFLCAGFQYQYPPGSADAAAWIIKLDSLGCDTPGCQYAGIPVYESILETLKIYPNPARDVVNVEMASSCQLPASSFEIADMFGKVMLKKELEAGKRKYEINVSKIPDGVYLLIIKVDNNIIRKKFVKI